MRTASVRGGVDQKEDDDDDDEIVCIFFFNFYFFTSGSRVSICWTDAKVFGMGSALRGDMILFSP